MKLFLLNITNFILSLLCHQSAAKGLRLNWIRESVEIEMMGKLLMNSTQITLLFIFFCF